MLDSIEPPKEGLGLDGIFLTHAHIGHYLGLAYLGREAAGAQSVPVYALPRMTEFLRTNGPWNQLVELQNIALREMTAKDPVTLPGGTSVSALVVPHRDEYSETAGFVIKSPAGKSAMFIPDIDSWSEWEDEQGMQLPEVVKTMDLLFVDATFFDDGELPGRDMSKIPHPRVTETMELLADMSDEQRAKVHFIHYNHSNPIRDPESEQSAMVAKRGFGIARRGARFCL